MLTGARCSVVEPVPTTIDIRPVEIVSESNAVNDDRYQMNIDKPRTGVESVDSRIDALIQHEQEAFLKSIDGITLPEGFSYEFQVHYQVVDYSDQIKTFVFEFYQYTGGAHGLPYTITMTVDFEHEEVLDLSQIFAPGTDYLITLSDLAITDLLGRDDGMMGDEQWVREGASAKTENFKRFALSSEGLIIYFDVYQVAPYAAGPQQVTISYSQLSGLLSERFSNR